MSPSVLCVRFIYTNLSDISRSDTLKKAKFFKFFGNSKHPASLDSDSAFD